VGEGIEFITAGPGLRPFDDIGDDSPIDDPEKMLKGWRAYRNGLQPEENFEAVIGRDTSLPASILQLLAEQRRAVGRISASGTNYKGEFGRWAGTGFLVGKNVLLTNHHVLNSPEVAKNASVDFEYEVMPTELIAGRQEPSAQPGKRSYRFDPTRLFLTSPATDGGLDFTFVWIETDSEAPGMPITMRRAAFAIANNEQAFVIHHPQGHGKRVSVDDVDVVEINTAVVRYVSDTMPGSSGSPVFDRQGRLFGLHHASKGGAFTRPDGRSVEVLNEGIKIGAIVLDLDRRRATSEKAMAEVALGLVQGSDTMAGFFGNLGRENRIPAAASGVEAVVDSYRGSDADVDIGFWNIEWLANRYHDPVKLREAAALITDLGLDIWGLEEVSPPAVAALVQELERNFGEKYAYALSEPNAPESKQSTAVIWKTKTVTGRQEDWPEEIERYWRLRSTDNLDGLEAVEGKIFNRYPGLFRFSAKGARSFDFYLVPLHLKAMAEGSKRRQLASRLLAKAVRLMTEKYRPGVDWVLGGDFNAELAS
ncbi:MAG: N-acetylmuramoyl-L-alanine amidase, partial [Hyphomicrobiaceae bacterium]